jgi:hypothetical protein
MKYLSGTVVLITLFCLVPYPVPAAEIDISGDYNFILEESSISGPCPLGKDGQGSLKIAKSGAGYTLGYLTGMVCNPPQVCVLSGTCTGDNCVFVTTVTVDDEGGTVTNTANLTFEKNHAVGNGSCVYKHPGGMQCTWTYLLTLTK